MITLFQVDKSGNDLFEKDYSIVLVLNKKEVYGVNIPQKIKDDLVSSFKKGELKITAPSDRTRKNRLRIRIHTAVIITLITKAIRDLGFLGDVNIEICNDIDGHFHEIKDMVFKHLIRVLPNIKPEDIILAKFQKTSLIDEAGKAFRNNDKDKLKDYNQVKLNLDELTKLVKK